MCIHTEAPLILNARAALAPENLLPAPKKENRFGAEAGERAGRRDGKGKDKLIFQECGDDDDDDVLARQS